MYSTALSKMYCLLDPPGLNSGLIVRDIILLYPIAWSLSITKLSHPGSCVNMTNRRASICRAPFGGEVRRALPGLLGAWCLKLVGVGGGVDESPSKLLSLLGDYF